ncbi:hypothetical protein BZG36_04221 [Bifiguratus adelaidae]|uniref:Store-operated calcium entry-associated regulatory factor n=1 Tax=Bifiguratus adelaidae TaxID=1938954 RepID=A0A261XY99_9FUNG|nr:hypothetical protein BZG36_04221 [Bifiguratus adelaidae]
MTPRSPTPWLLAVLCLFLSTLSLAAPDKVLLQKVTAITLHANKPTAARRSSPIHQLTCYDARGCAPYVPEVVQCYNVGWDGTDVQWRCEADLPKGIKFGDVEVSCEGYDYPDDPYILKGSCGLSYSLIGTERRESDVANDDPRYFPQSKPLFTYDWASTKKKWDMDRLIGKAFSYLWAGVALYIVYSIYQGIRHPQSSRRRPSPYPSGGHFPGDDDSHDPPPPYSPHDDPRKPQSHTSAFPSMTQVRDNAAWAGSLAAAAAAGYMFGNRNRRDDRPYRTQQYSPPSSYASARRSTEESSSSYTSTSRSTGYGGTKRR